MKSVEPPEGEEGGECNCGEKRLTVRVLLRKNVFFRALFQFRVFRIVVRRPLVRLIRNERK